MGWQDRDWAKWTDDERRRFVGGGVSIVPGAVLGVVISLVVTVMLAQPFARHRAAPAPVWGDGVVAYQWGHDTTCTELRRLGNSWTCEVWTFLLPGQGARPAAALLSGQACATVVADQSLRRWVCAASS